MWSKERCIMRDKMADMKVIVWSKVGGIMRDKMADTELGKAKRKKTSLLSLFPLLYRLLQTANVVSKESIDMKVCHSVNQ